jgi:hypothetical protein
MRQLFRPRTWKLVSASRREKPARRRSRNVRFLLHLETLESRLAPANVDVLSFHNDTFISGQNLQETTLTPGNVNATSFGRLFSQLVDGYVYAQPLYKANLTIPSKGVHNVAFVATEHDSVYAFDADNLSLLWQRSFIDPANGITSVPNGDVGSGDIVPEIGITGAPVIDAASNTIYFVAKTKETRADGVHYVQRLHALDIATGADKYIVNPNPVLSGYMIGDSKGGEGYANQTSVIHVAGNGADSGGGDLKFDAFREAQRPSLQLLGGRVYVAWASHGDNGSYHGWVVGFNETTLQPEKWWNSTPNARGSGIWQSEGAVSTDGTYLYFAVGNAFNGPKPGFSVADGDYSEAVIKLDPTTAGTALTVKDYFVPHDWQQLDNADADLGSGGVMLLPDSVGSAAHQHLLVETGKSGKIYLIDRTNMGQFNASADNVVQIVTAGQAGVWGNPSFFQESPTSGIIYYHGQGDVTKAYRISNGVITPAAPAYTSTVFSGFPGAQPTISASGQNNATAIDWELQVDNYGQQGQAILHAFAARPAAASGTLNELYNSSQTGQRDTFGGSVKFTNPIITNGHVYVGAEYRFSLFGLFPQSSAVPPTPTNLMASGVSNSQIALTWTNPAPGPNNAPTGIKIFRSTGDDMHYGTTPLTTVARDATTFTDSGLDPAQVYFYKLVATNQTGDAPASAEARGTPAVTPPALQVGNASAKSVTLTWTRPQVANDHYNVERSNNNFQTFTTIATNLPGTQTSYTDTTVTTGTYQYRVRAFTNPAGSNFALSNVVQARVGAGSAIIDYLQNNSFPADPADLQANGNAQFAEGTARLVRQNATAGSVFSLNQENILNWTTQFTVRLHEGTQPNYADGFTFVIQANSPYALGAGQGGLGYQGITNSVAIKFDTFQNMGETSANSTGLYSGGANPGGPANGTTVFDLDPAKVNLRSQSSKVIVLSYRYNAANPAASVLHESITDPDHPNTPFIHDYMVDIPSLLGDPLAGNSTAYVGFTAATGDSNWWEINDITSWRFTPTGAAAPRAVTATPSGSNAIDLAWKNTSADEAGFAIFRATSANGMYTQIGTVPAGVNTYHDANLAPGNYFYRVKATNADNSSSGFSSTAFNSVGVNRISVAHSDGFTDHTDLQANGVASFPGSGQNAVGIFTAQQDIGPVGDPSQPGSAAVNNGTYTIKASGSDIWNDTDHFHYVYRPLSGDGEIVARILSLGQTDGWAKSGVMIRASTDPHSPQVSMDFSAQNGSSLQWRDSQGAQSGSIDEGAGTAPYPGWVRLVRSGNTFTAYWASDNNGSPGTWNPAGTHVTAMGTNVLIGLAVTAHNNGAVTTSMVDHVSITPLSPVALQLTDGGGSEAASAFATMRLPTTLFNTSFILQDNPVNGAADGVSFVLHNDPRGTAALGGTGGAEGYAGIINSIAIKFDLYTHGSHVPSTGLFTGGQAPDSDPSKDILLAPYGLNLGSGHPIQVNISYNGSSLIERLTDTVTGAAFTHSYAINLAQVLGGPVAYAGFTGGTGGETATQMITSWTGDFFAPATATTAFLVASFPSSIKSGTVGSITVTAKAAGGTTDTSYRGTIHFTSSDPAAMLPADYTFTTADNGVHTFNVTLNTVGIQSITVGDAANPLLLGAQTNIQVKEAVPTTALAIGFPIMANVGVPTPLTLTARDANGNVAVGYRGTVHFGSTDTKAGLPADYTFTAADNGVHTFILTLNTAGKQRLATIDLNNPAILGFQDVQVLLSPPTPINFVNFSDPGSLQANGAAKFSPDQTPVGIFKGHQDVGTPGNPNPAGSATFANGTYTLRASGSDIWDNNDHLQYVYEMLTGDGEFIARMASFNNPDYWSKAGLMIRSDLTTGAQNAFMLETGPNNNHNEPIFQWRTNEFGGSSDSGNHNGPIQAAPVWLRLVRAGNNFSGYWAKDLGGGQHGPWMQMGTTQSINMPTTVYIGLADTAHNNGQVATATFDSVSIAGNTSAALPAPAAEVTDGWMGEAGSIFTRARVPIGNFTTSFTLHTMPTLGAADGLTFTIQNDPRGAGALGDGGGALGYGKGDGTTNPPAIAKSVAIEFNLYSNGSHASTTKLLLNGQVDGNSLIDMSSAGIDLKNGHPLLVTLTYDGTNLVETVQDTVSHATFTHTYTVNIPSTVGSTAAYLGFTGGTGGEAAVVDVLNWAGKFVVAPQAAQLAASAPAASTAGTSFQVTVKASDIFGNTFTDYAGTVHFTSSDPQAGLPADYTFTAADNGVHTFTVTLKTAGSQTVTVTDLIGPSFLTSSAMVTVSPAATNALMVSGLASPIVAGMAGSITVTAKDAYGNVATSYTGMIHFTSSDAQAALPGDYTFTAGDHGVHTFSVALKTVGSQSVTATDTMTGSIAGVQSGIVVMPAAAAVLVVNGFPSPSVAGTAGMLTITAKDAYGNVATGYTGMIHFTSSDGQAVLPANYTFTTGDHGVHTFSATLKTAGSQSLTATDTSTGSITGMQSGIVVTAAAATALTLAGFPSPTTAGVAGMVTVTARDAYGNIATGYNAAVVFSSSDVQAVLPGFYRFTAADAGVHTFTATLKTAGTQTLTVNDGTLSSTQMGIVVTPAAAAALVVSGFPSPVTAGVAGMVTVTAKDAYGNVATGYTGTVHFTSSDAQAGLPADYPFVAGDQGVHTFSATLKTAGSQSLTATDMATGSISGTQAGIVVNPGPTSVLVVFGFPSSTVAGTPGSVVVVAEDAYGNVTPGYQGTVDLTSSDPLAALEGDHTFTAADNGRYAFGVVLFTAGTQSITATDTSDDSITGTQDGIVVVAAAATRFAVDGFPSPVTAGTPGTITVTALDPYGNVDTNFAGTVHLSSTDPQAQLDPDYTFTPDDAGMAVFNATLYTAGTQSITVTDTDGNTGTQDGIQVVPGPVSQFPLAAPASTVAGTPFDLTVYAEDQYGNIVPDYTGTVHFTSTDAQAGLPADYTFTADDAGVHTFTVSLATAGDQTITVTDTDGNIGSVTITVTPAAANHFQVMAPDTVAHDVPFTVTVMALDPYGNVDTNYRGTVTWSSSDSNANFDPNPYTFTQDDAGVASFTVTLHLIGFQNITITDANGVTGSATINVTFGDGPSSGSGDTGRDWARLVMPQDVAGQALQPAPRMGDSVQRLVEANAAATAAIASDLWAGDSAPLASPEVLDLALGNLDGGLPYGAPLDDLIPTRRF